MYQNNYSYYPQTQQATQIPSAQPRYQAYAGLKGRPVSSIEEARAMSIDFDGSVFYFPDLANKRIYTKQINLDGTATLLMYELKEIPVQPEANTMNYITREEFENALQELRGSLNRPEAPPAAEIPKQTIPLNF